MNELSSHNENLLLICSHCGHENRDGARFCRNCGQLLSVPKADELASTQSSTGLTNVKPDQQGHHSTVEQPALSDARRDDLSSIESDPELAKNDLASVSDAPGDQLLPPEAGMLIQDRFEVLQVLEVDEQGFLLEALDLGRCWNCDFVQSGHETQFCENCGAELINKPAVILHAQSLATAPVHQLEGGFVQAGYYYQIEHFLVHNDQDNPPGHALRLVSGYQSHPGQVRENNEDSLIVLQLAGLQEDETLPVLGCYAVADGVGGAALGELASRAALKRLATYIMQQIFTPLLLEDPTVQTDLSDVLKASIRNADQAILDLQQEMDESSMGCTLTTLLVHNQQALVGNVGDSRTYLLRDGVLKPITRDHSLVARLVEQGLIQPEEAYTHHHRSVIYRSLGSLGEADVDVFDLGLERGDRLLLCSDGLWEKVHAPLLEEILLERHDPQFTCDHLVDLANLAGGDDNISVIVVDVV